MLEFELHGLDRVEQFAEFFPGWFENRAVQLVGEALAEDASLRLENETSAPDGSPWKQWSDSYAKTRGAGHKLLFGEGDLSESLEVVMRGDSFQLVSELPYAAVHQHGSEDGTIEARPFAGPSDEIEIALSDILDADMERSFARV
jgi:phage virion morphogenesis protein